MNKIKRLDIRKSIRDAGEGLYESIPVGPLRWFVGDMMALNEDYVLNHSTPEMNIASSDILKYGFTLNQLQWINELKEMYALFISDA